MFSPPCRPRRQWGGRCSQPRGQVVALLCGLSHKIRIPAIRIRECRFINKILRIRIPESLFSYCENKDCGNSDFMGQTAAPKIRPFQVRTNLDDPMRGNKVSSKTMQPNEKCQMLLYPRGGRGQTHTSVVLLVLVRQLVPSRAMRQQVRREREREGEREGESLSQQHFKIGNAASLVSDGTFRSFTAGPNSQVPSNLPLTTPPT